MIIINLKDLCEIPIVVEFEKYHGCLTSMMFFIIIIEKRKDLNKQHFFENAL